MSCSRCGSPVVSFGLCPACQRAENAEIYADRRHAENRTENCLVCGNPVSTGRGSGFWLDAEPFKGRADIAFLLQSMRAMQRWMVLDPWNCGVPMEAFWGKDRDLGGEEPVWRFAPGFLSGEVAPGNAIGDPSGRVPILRHLKPFVRARIGEPVFPRLPDGWDELERKLASFEDDCVRNVESQNRQGPLCCRRCYEMFLSNDPVAVKTLEDRRRIAANAAALCSSPEFQAARKTIDDFSGFLAAFDNAQSIALREWNKTRDAWFLLDELIWWHEDRGRKKGPFPVSPKWVENMNRLERRNVSRNPPAQASGPAPAQRPASGPNGPKDGAPSFLFLLDVSVWPVIPAEGLRLHVPEYFRKRGERLPARADGFNFSIGTVSNGGGERTGTLGLSVWLCTNEQPGIHPNGKRVWWQPLDDWLEPGNEYDNLQYEALFDADARTGDDRAVLIAVEESNSDGYWHVVGGWSFPPEDIPWLSSLPATQAAGTNTPRRGTSTFQRPKSDWLNR